MRKLDEIKKKAEYCLNCIAKPCTKGCPLGNNIPDFIKCIKEEKYEDAYRVLCDTTVLQPICGRICPHQSQCQGKCVRGIKDEPVSIGELETFIGDMAIEEGWQIDDLGRVSDCISHVDDTDRDESNDLLKSGLSRLKKKVAVVGSGPAGLTCASFLARKGVKVTIYEKHDKIGGLLRYGIPKFRLDRNVLDKQIEKILELGIEVVCGKTLGEDYSLKDLRSEYDAVFLAFGANVSRKMDISGEGLNGVFGGNELLENGKHPDYKGKKVAVIGGGNVAMDVSRTIKRLGADKVYIIYRRAEEQMPAEKKEIVEAKQDGIEFLFQSNLVKINGEFYVTGVECVKTKLVEKEGSDRLVPVDIDGSNFLLDMDYVMMAVGAEAEKNVLSGLGVELNKWGYINVDENFMTSIPNVFAGGDLIGTKATVAWAARNGRDAAKGIYNLSL